jgi:hypothetical protein
MLKSRLKIKWLSTGLNLGLCMKHLMSCFFSLLCFGKVKSKSTGSTGGSCSANAFYDLYVITNLE